MTQALQNILAGADVWKAGKGIYNNSLSFFSSGHRVLDRALPYGGWPLGALTELLVSRPGQGEMQLLLPALARMSQKQWVMMIAPPYIPYATMLSQAGVNLSHLLLVHPKNDKDALWAMEQALTSGCCGAVIAWPRRADMGALRRLQLAAEAGSSMAVLIRHEHQMKQSSPAALRVRANVSAAWMQLDVVKCRGGVVPQQVVLPLVAEPFSGYANAHATQASVVMPLSAASVNNSPEPVQMAMSLNKLPPRRQMQRPRRHRHSSRQIVA